MACACSGIATRAACLLQQAPSHAPAWGSHPFSQGTPFLLAPGHSLPVGTRHRGSRDSGVVYALM